jgi:hypothetical protein
MLTCSVSRHVSILSLHGRFTSLAPAQDSELHSSRRYRILWSAPWPMMHPMAWLLSISNDLSLATTASASAAPTLTVSSSQLTRGGMLGWWCASAGMLWITQDTNWPRTQRERQFYPSHSPFARFPRRPLELCCEGCSPDRHCGNQILWC